MAVIAAGAVGCSFLWFSMDQRRVIASFYALPAKSSDSLSPDRLDNVSAMGKQVKRKLPYGRKHANVPQ